MYHHHNLTVSSPQSFLDTLVLLDSDNFNYIVQVKIKLCLYLKSSGGIASLIQSSGFKLCNPNGLAGNVFGIRTVS